jgi:hypothetical protein
MLNDCKVMLSHEEIVVAFEFGFGLRIRHFTHLGGDVGEVGDGLERAVAQLIAVHGGVLVVVRERRRQFLTLLKYGIPIANDIATRN